MSYKKKICESLCKMIDILTLTLRMSIMSMSYLCRHNIITWWSLRKCRADHIPFYPHQNQCLREQWLRVTFPRSGLVNRISFISLFSFNTWIPLNWNGNRWTSTWFHLFSKSTLSRLSSNLSICIWNRCKWYVSGHKWLFSTCAL